MATVNESVIRWSQFTLLSETCLFFSRFGVRRLVAAFLPGRLVVPAAPRPAVRRTDKTLVPLR